MIYYSDEYGYVYRGEREIETWSVTQSLIKSNRGWVPVAVTDGRIPGFYDRLFLVELKHYDTLLERIKVLEKLIDEQD